MEIAKVWELVKRTEFAQLGFVDELGEQNIRTVWCTWHKGLRLHYISTNTSSMHVQSLKVNKNACLYFYDSRTFEGVCFQGKAIAHQEKEYREMLWAEDSIKYYPEGVEDEDYTVLEFIAEKGRYYGEGDSYNISHEDIKLSECDKTLQDFFEFIHAEISE